MIRRILLMAAVLVALAAAPAAAQYGGGPVVTVGGTTVVAGAQVTVGGTGFVAGETVALTLGGPCGTASAGGGTPLGTVVVGPDGSFSTAVTLPSDVEPGTYGIYAAGATSRSCTNITVGEAGGSTGAGTVATGTLARTGTSSIKPLTAAGAGLVTAGGMVLLFATRRRRSHARA
ncbi:MAG: hypothetical protein JWN46_1744 [Acidimicrobiales bacterium]|nr:hypothetical protein [Acidimicrobiales bacterium]